MVLILLGNSRVRPQNDPTLGGGDMKPAPSAVSCFVAYLTLALSLLLIVVAAANFIPGRAQAPAPNPSRAATQGATAAINPLKVALLKWFPAYQSTSFSVGKCPIGIAFDGADVWVSNQYGASVTELRANDGTNLGTFSVGSGPTGIAFDGANIWTANSFGSDVTKLRASDGKVLGTFPVGQAPMYLAFD